MQMHHRLPASPIPCDSYFDSSIPFLRDPYRHIGRRARELHSDVFQTRLLLQPTICMTGAEAAELFYDEDRFARAGAAPLRLTYTLFGKGGIQNLDGEEHKRRKQMFMSLMMPERVAALNRLVRKWSLLTAPKWLEHERITLYDELQGILARAVCEWAGVPLPESEFEKRSNQLVALFDKAGAIGPKHWWSRIARRKANNWMEDFIQDVRLGKEFPPAGSPADVIAHFSETTGKLLHARVAAVELLNVLRPVVAVSVYLTLTALALHEHPYVREHFKDRDDDYPDLFAQEVRRFYPFFPAVAAKTRIAFEWRGLQFPAHRRVLLDLYGTNHDPRAWQSPHEFRPDRFRTDNVTPFNFIPQGGGFPYRHHRCPGESIAHELIKNTADFLINHLTYNVPRQDLRLDMTRLPALPKSHFQIEVLGVRG